MYLEFNQTICLQTMIRQQDEEQAGFHTALTNLQDGNPMVEDWRLLTTCIANQVPNLQLHFKDAICIYTTNDVVNSYNYEHLERLVNNQGNLRPI